MRLIITRHGETEENKAGIMQGHLPGTLSELGVWQARRLAERLKGEKIDLIISSDLARALDTAKIIAKFHSDVDLILDERLRERFLGEFQGKTKESLGIPKTRQIADFIDGKNAEGADEFFDRAGVLIKYVLKRTEGDIFLVWHNGIFKAVIGNIIGKRDLKQIEGLKNTSVSIFEVENGEIKEVLLNCVGHL